MRLDNFFRFFYGKDHPAASYHQTATKMTPIKNISIPKPCHQSWQQMTPVNAGRHCQSCCKTVTDFTKMSNQQIIEHLSLTRNVCGRFNEQQLNGINYKLYADDLPATSGWKRLAMALSIISAGFWFKASAQTKPAAVEQGPGAKNDLATKSTTTMGKIARPDSSGFRVITGHVIDERNEPIPGVSIKISTGYTGTLTDMNGNFRLRVSNTITQFTTSFIGFNTQTINIGADSVYPLKLQMQAGLLGEVVVAKRASFIRRVYYRCIKRPIRKIFN
jgi:hypothetical protein